MITDKELKQLKALREDSFDLPLSVELNVSGKFLLINGNDILFKGDYRQASSFIYGMVAMNTINEVKK